jgi:hypothetical protein
MRGRKPALSVEDLHGIHIAPAEARQHETPDDRSLAARSGKIRSKRLTEWARSAYLPATRPVAQTLSRVA